VRGLIQSECNAGQRQCPPEWCSDDVESTVLDVTLVAPDHGRGCRADGQLAPAPTVRPAAA
jgi:hypothetical protein